MALTDTPWCGFASNKLFLQSGKFSSTLKTSQDVSAIDIESLGISWNGTDTPWTGRIADKLYLTSGQFSSTLKTSESIGAIDISPLGMSWDGVNTPWTGLADVKLYLQSGQFTSTLKTSLLVSAVDTVPTGMSYDGTNTPWSGFTDKKLYLQSGQFTSTLKTSEDMTSIDSAPNDLSWDGTDTLWAGAGDDKLYLTSGQFTSTIKTSLSVTTIDVTPEGIDTNDYWARLDIMHTIVTPATIAIVSTLEPIAFPGIPTIVSVNALSLAMATQAPSLVSDYTATPDTLTLGLIQEGMTIMAGTDVFVIILPLALGITIATVPPVISGSTVLLLPNQTMIVLESNLSLHAPSINITNDIKILVTNTRNFAISEYSNFTFNSMCLFNGKYLYAKADGIYEGGGNNDNGTQIDASYKSGVIDTYTTEVQRLKDAYLSFRSDGDVQLFSVGDEINARAYFITTSVGSTIHERRVKFEKGIKDRHFNIGISNVSGSTLEVDSIKVLTEPIRKRR